MKLYLYKFEIFFLPQLQLSSMSKLFMVYCKYARKKKLPCAPPTPPTPPPAQQHLGVWTKSVFIESMFVYDFEIAAIKVIQMLV